MSQQLKSGRVITTTRMWRGVLFLSISLFLQIGICEAQVRNGKIQRSFGAEDEVTQPVGLPDEVLKSLRADRRVLSCLETGQTSNDITANWFIASAVDLKGDRADDLVVVANNPCLFGANIVPFWVFRKASDNYQLVLAAHGLQLELLASRTRTVRNVRVHSATARKVSSKLYRFDGSAYR